MNSKIYSKITKILIFFFIFVIPSYNSAKEVLIYADSITYDKEKNIIARGNAKIFRKNKLIVSDLIIFNKESEKIILPSKFTFKDENNNFFEGENGFFYKNLELAEFNNPKIKLNDGSRIIGKKIKKKWKNRYYIKGCIFTM